MTMSEVSADVHLPSLFGDHMVLQQLTTVVFRGSALPGETIAIQTPWDNRIHRITTGGDATWQLPVGTPAAGGPYRITIRGYNEIVIDDVLIGEVWLCSGQSNMEWSYQHGLTSVEADFNHADNPSIRFFSVPKRTSNFPQDDVAGKWVVCDAASLRSFSAVGYYFGRQLHHALPSPIGLINASWGGTPAEVWTPATAIRMDPVLQQAADKQIQGNWWPVLPGKTYNAMIHPLTGFAMAGAIWYQGESNTGTADTYTRLLQTMIQSWRQAWGKEFPFYYVQIAPYRYDKSYIGALLQEAQAKALNLYGTGMITISDLVDDVSDIHPIQKQEVGIRLANKALASTYAIEGMAHLYPAFQSLHIDANQAVISFRDAPQGLTIRGDAVIELQIAGSDRVFHAARSRLEKDQLIVWSDEVPQPTAVRYGFDNAAIGNLFSRDGLPVVPFRTDNWSVDTGPAHYQGIPVASHLASGKKVSVDVAPSPKYGSGSLSMLTDDIAGDTDFHYHWLGWENARATLALDLGSVQPIHQIQVSSLYKPASWILHPRAITCSVSTDGVYFEKKQVLTVEGDQKKEAGIRSFVFDRIAGRWRYIRLFVEGAGVLFDWHPNAGNDAWMFLDEIQVK